VSNGPATGGRSQPRSQERQRFLRELEAKIPPDVAHFDRDLQVKLIHRGLKPLDQDAPGFLSCRLTVSEERPSRSAIVSPEPDHHAGLDGYDTLSYGYDKLSYIT